MPSQLYTLRVEMASGLGLGTFPVPGSLDGARRYIEKMIADGTLIEGDRITVLDTRDQVTYVGQIVRRPGLLSGLRLEGQSTREARRQARERDRGD